MLHLLKEALKELPDLLGRDGPSWNSLYIDYHKPFVSRVWIPWRDNRINLHKIEPCLGSEALYHPHPWPSAMIVLDGAYMMNVGHGQGLEKPPVAATMLMTRGSCYEMTDVDAWHSVQPLETTYSIMITGTPTGRIFPGPNKDLRGLTKLEIIDLLTMGYLTLQRLELDKKSNSFYQTYLTNTRRGSK